MGKKIKLSNKVIIIVEGETDKNILTYIFYAAKYPIKRINIVVAGGKNQIFKTIREIDRRELDNIVVLFDSDEANIPDSNKYAKEMLSNYRVEGVCAVPTIEAWIFADDMLLNKITDNISDKNIIKRLPLPEEISYPKYLQYQLFKSKYNDLSFIKEMNIERACVRTPSLKNFLLLVSKKLGIEDKELEESYSRYFSRDIIMNLVKEVVPKETIIYKTLDGEQFTAGQMEKEIGNGSIVGKEYASDILRLARDILKRRAERSE